MTARSFFGIYLYEGRGLMRFIGKIEAPDQETALSIAQIAAARDPRIPREDIANLTALPWQGA
jgi:hypothetical protein